MENIKNERDQITIKQKQFIYKLQQAQEISQDKDEEIEKLRAEKEILTNAKNIIKKSYDGLNLKYKGLQDDNYLIPKKGKDDQKDKDENVKTEDEMVKQLQGEIRDLHFKMRQKEQIIEEFKKEAEAYVDLKKNDGGVTERSSKLE